MSNCQVSGSISSFWKNLKRALISAPDIQNGTSSCADCGMGVINSSNYSNNLGNEPLIITDRPMDNNIEIPSKRHCLNIVTEKIGRTEENSFMETMKNLLSCSICFEVNSYSNQCPNGHLICITCSGRLQQNPGEVNCPVCRISLKQGLHRSLLAEQLTSELPAACKHCNDIMPVKCIKKHETDECSKRIVPCKYKIFGCTWVGIQENSKDHEESCSISYKTVGILNDIVSANVNKDIQLLQIPLQIWRSIMSKIKVQAVGSRLLVRQVTLNKSLGEDFGQMVYRSPMIRVPFSCCNLHGFYIDIYVTKCNESDSEKLHYVLKSENRTKITLNFYLASIKVNESLNLEVQDSLHSHHFESSHRDSPLHEFKIISLDCEKDIPSLLNMESIFAEICFIAERERSEKGHGILSSSDEDESNPFIANGSDSNVVFTLFSPTTSSTRSINTSNAVIAGNDDANITNEVEPSHEEDIVITVTDNIDSDDISTENRDNFIMRNNHSFVAVPSVFINPATSLFSYPPFQIDNSFMNNFPLPRINMENVSNEQTIQPAPNSDTQRISGTDQELLGIQFSNGNRISSNTMNDQIIPPDLNRIMREPVQMCLYYPPQTIVSPFITNSVSPITPRPTTSRNIMIRPRLHSNPLQFRQLHIVNNSDEINLFNSFENFNNETSGVTGTLSSNSNGNNEMTVNQSNPDQNRIPSFPYNLDQSLTLQDSILQEEVEH